MKLQVYYTCGIYILIYSLSQKCSSSSFYDKDNVK